MSPARRRCRPDIAGGPADLAILQRTDTHHHHVVARRRVAEQLRAALGAEAAAHGVAAVRGADILRDLAAQREARGLEDCIDRGVAGGEILAIPTPAGPQRDRRLAELETDGAAEAAAFDRLGHW